MLIVNEVLAANEIGGVEGSDELIEKGGKLLKTEKLSKGLKLSKSGNSKGTKSAKSKKLLKSRNSSNFDTKKVGPSFLTFKARVAFNHLWLAFTKAPILRYFDPECHIWIKTDASSYAISGMLNQLVSGTRPDGVVIKTNLGQWYLIAFFSRKMIQAKIQYETHNDELLAIVEAFKT